MPAYKYRAVHASGRIAHGHIAAANERELTQHLGYSGLELIEAHARKETRSQFRWRQRIAPRTLAVFSAQMADLLKAGVSFADALQDIIKSAENGILRDALTDIHRAINHGSRIAAAFALYPRLFPPVFTAILAAGETSGNLDGTFTQLTRYAETRARTQEQLRRALRYPLFLLLVAFGVTAFMMAMVVPQIIAFLNTIDSQLPVTTKILIAVSRIFAECWWMIILAAIVLAATLSLLRLASERAALFIDALLLRIPVLGGVVEKLALARFANSFAILFQSGVGILASLRSAKATLGNRALESALDGAEQQVRSGRSLSMAMTGILPPFAISMIRTGEKSGRLGKSLDDIAASYDREVADVTQRLIAMLEPALTILIGGILAWIFLAVLGPIYGSLSKLNGVG